MYSRARGRMLTASMAAGLVLMPLLAHATDPVDPDYSVLVTAVWTKFAAGMTLVFAGLGAILGITFVIKKVMRTVKGI